MSSNSLSARIVILNYNGLELLKECLPSIREAMQSAKTKTYVTILDNLSSDMSVDYVTKNFPEFNVFKASANLILCSYNEYLPMMSEDIAILLNNDIRVDKNFVDALVARFESDPTTFLVAPKVMSFDGSSVEAGTTKGGIRWGLYWADARFKGYEAFTSQPSETISSGFGAFSRAKFLALGGYDPRFLPGIIEDIDICYRARRAGYKLYYEPRSIVYHMGQATFKKHYGSDRVALIAHRNNFLFMWKNFSGPAFWLPHLFFLPLRLVFAALKGNHALWKGFIEALKKGTS